MIFWILQRIIVSLVLILCAHYIFIFLKTNLTTPKTRDLVNQPREKYKEMYEKINKIQEKEIEVSSNSMKDELKNYLKDLKKSNMPTENTVSFTSTQEKSIYSSY
jgi:hypothetical protein